MFCAAAGRASADQQTRAGLPEVVEEGVEEGVSWAAAGRLGWIDRQNCSRGVLVGVHVDEAP